MAFSAQIASHAAQICINSRKWMSRFFIKQDLKLEKFIHSSVIFFSTYHGVSSLRKEAQTLDKLGKQISCFPSLSGETAKSVRRPGERYNIYSSKRLLLFTSSGGRNFDRKIIHKGSFEITAQLRSQFVINFDLFPSQTTTIS